MSNDISVRPIVVSHMTRNIAVATPPMVLWKDTKTLTASTDPDDPAGCLSDTNLIVMHNPDGLPWLCAFPLISGSTVPTVALKGNFFGFLPFTNTEQAQKAKPSIVNPTYFDDSVLGSARNRRNEENTAAVTVPGLWIQLRELDAATAALVTFDNTKSADKDSVASSTKQQITLTPRYLYTQGLPQIVFLPTVAHDVGDAAMLIGFLHS